jgi:hypothetical protein
VAFRLPTAPRPTNLTPTTAAVKAQTQTKNVSRTESRRWVFFFAFRDYVDTRRQEEGEEFLRPFFLRGNKPDFALLLFFQIESVRNWKPHADTTTSR